MTPYLPSSRGKRLTETSKWTEPWFRRLTPTAKGLWTWLNDNCDYAGVIDVDLELAAFQIGEAIEEKHLAELGDRLQALPNGKFWLRDFIPSQYGAKLSPDCSAHRAVLKLIQAHNLPYPNTTTTLGQPLTNPNPTHSLPIPNSNQAHSVVLTKTTGHGHGHGHGQKGGVGENNSQVVHNSTFKALTLANRIVSNQDEWHYDNCKVNRDRLNAAGLRSVIEPYTARVVPKQILAAWGRAVTAAHGAKVDGLAKDPTAYAVTCFKTELNQLCQPKALK